MAKFPMLPIWTDAFLADTEHLGSAQLGAYVRLLFTAWRRPDCDLPDDDKFLCKVTRCDLRTWRRYYREPLAALHSVDNGLWIQKRLQETRAKSERFRQHQRDNAQARWSKSNGLDDATAMPTHGTSQDAKKATIKRFDESGNVHDFEQAKANKSNGMGDANAMPPHGNAFHNPYPDSEKKENPRKGFSFFSESVPAHRASASESDAGLGATRGHGRFGAVPETRPIGWEFQPKRWWKPHWRVDDLNFDNDDLERRARYDVWLVRVKAGLVEGKNPDDY